MVPILLSGALSGLVLLAGVGAALSADRPLEGRLGDLDRPRRRGPRKSGEGLTGLIDAIGRPLAPTVAALLGRPRVEAWDDLLDAAGRPAGITTYALAGRKGAYALVLPFASLPLALDGAVWLPLVLAVLGFFLPDVALRSQASERQEEITRSMPDFLDVLAVTVSAGLDFRAALERVADAFRGPLTEEVRTALQEMRLGAPRREALDNLRRRNRSESLSEFVTALQQAEDLGAPLTGALADIAEDIRRAYGQQARREAAKVEPRLSVLLTVTLVPGALITIFVGFYLSTEADFGALLGG